MNTLPQVEETGAHTRWTCIHTYSVNLTQPPFTVSLQGGVQWLVMMCSELVHVSFHVFMLYIVSSTCGVCWCLKVIKPTVKMDQFCVVCVSVCALPLLSANLCESLCCYYDNSTGLSVSLQSHFLRKLDLFSL